MQLPSPAFLRISIRPCQRQESRRRHRHAKAAAPLCPCAAVRCPQNQWSPIYDVSAILTSIQSLLSDPNPNSPANSEVGRPRCACRACLPTRAAAQVPGKPLPRRNARPVPSTPHAALRRAAWALPASVAGGALPRGPAARARACLAAADSSQHALPPGVQAARLYTEDRKEYNRRVKAVVEASWADDGEEEEEGDEDGA